MDSKSKKNIVLCGRSGDGKSSIANMLIQGDVYRDSENDFRIGNSAKAVTEYLTAISNEKFVVYDTIGLGDSTGSDEAIKAIRNFFSMGKIPLNYICYVKRSRSLKDDVRLFETYRKIFGDGEKNFVIIITHSGPEWAKEEENVKLIKEQLGNYPVISVDFPCNENEKYTLVDRKQRAESLEHLLNEFSKLEYNGIEPEVLSPSQNIENNMAGYFSFVPVVGSVYQLTASGFYYVTGKEKTARKRLLDGSLGLVCDAAGVVTGIGKPAAFMLVKDISLRAVKVVVMGINKLF
ncbi:hypothetical protein RirG_260010 [Rhizophagus irregularis DAOM 197198w]|uniref:AIG1-type G domain-containing protein n=1 Tax=Rhizophagus irregularis (strain DAOM 197198w) TaxID=1432141 RepID=A0A015LA51_RHIIW|nr:hypothetical protein RirG_260010 [Rhizophagus irregularis DAOM 197198w]